MADVPTTVAILRYFAGLARNLDGANVAAEDPELRITTVREPVGVVAALIPWNSPLISTALKLAPALAAGNTVVLKPSEFAAPSVVEFGLRTADLLPPGVLNIVTGFGPEAGAALVGHAGVDKISFTGGVPTARAILHAAADNVTPAILELGGKSAFVICPDADLDARGRRRDDGDRLPERRGLLRRLPPLPPRGRSATSSSPASPRSSAGCGSATRSTPRPRSDRWSRPPTASASSATSSAPSPKAASCSAAAARLPAEGELADGFYVTPGVDRRPRRPHRGRPRRGLRPGRHRPDLARGRRSDRARQPQRVRARGRRLDLRPGPRASLRRPRSRPARSGSTPGSTSAPGSRSAGSKTPATAAR